MKSRSNSQQSKLPVQQAKDALALREHAELQRQGAKAAARGETASSNPMHDTPNMPAATGESEGTWQRRHDAWQHGHNAQSSSTPAEVSRPAPQKPKDGNSDMCDASAPQIA